MHAFVLLFLAHISQNHTSSKVNFVFRCSFGYPVRIIREVNIRREIQRCRLCAVWKTVCSSVSRM